MFMVLHLNEVLHVDSVNNGMQNSQVNTKSIIKSWVFHICPLISFLDCNYGAGVIFQVR